MPNSNQSKFESLLAIAQCLDKIPGREKLASYCRFKERGLRKQAFSELGLYIQLVNSLDCYSIRKHCRDIIELNVRNTSAQQFLTNPLRRQLLNPTLEEWALSNPYDPFAAKWHAILNHKPGLLMDALALNEKDNHLRTMLINHELSDVEFAMHHLDEDSFIGDEESAENALTIVSTLLEPVNNDPAFLKLRKEKDELSQMLCDWQEFKKTNGTGFAKWCVARGREYYFPKKFYY